MKDKFGWLNIILVIILAFSIIKVSVTSGIYKNFKDVPSALNFLEKGKVYTNLSTVTKLAIEERYPPLIANNVILATIADKVLDFVITPTLFEKAAEPVLKASVAFAKAPTSIADDKVIVATAQYKTQAKEAVANLGLPGIVSVNVDYIIDAVPANITLVDLEKRPNSPLGIILKLRTFLEFNHTIMNISWFVIFVTLVILFIHGLKHLRNFFKAVWIAFLSGGLITIALCLALPAILGLILPEATTDLLAAENALVIDAATYLASTIQKTAMIFTFLGLIMLAAWKFIDFAHFQAMVDKRLKKVHMPDVSVKVK